MAKNFMKENSIEGTNHLKIISAPSIINALKEEKLDEEILFSCSISKQNRYNRFQERKLMLTTLRLINIEEKKIKC